MISWVKELNEKLDNSTSIEYAKLQKLKEDKFQGNLRINFNAGRVSSINIYDTVKM